MPRTKTAAKKSTATTKTKTTKSKAAPEKATQFRSTQAAKAKATAAKAKAPKAKESKPGAIKPKTIKPKDVKKKAPKPLTPEQLQEQRSLSARKAALARWSKERPPSKRELRQQLSRVPSSELTVEHYADRANPELSWAAAILKRGRSGENQRKKAAEIMSRYGVPNSRGKLAAYLKALSPEKRHEIAQRAGRRRWEIWREEQARLQGRDNFYSR